MSYVWSELLVTSCAWLWKMRQVKKCSERLGLCVHWKKRGSSLKMFWPSKESKMNSQNVSFNLQLYVISARIWHLKGCQCDARHCITISIGHDIIPHHSGLMVGITSMSWPTHQRQTLPQLLQGDDALTTRECRKSLGLHLHAKKYVTSYMHISVELQVSQQLKNLDDCKGC